MTRFATTGVSWKIIVILPSPPVHSDALPPARDGGAGRAYAFLGFGELGRQLAGLFLTPEERARAVFFDDAVHAAGAPGSQPFADYVREEHAARAWIIGLGYKHLALKERLADELLTGGRELPTLVHPRAYVNATARLEAGSVVYPLANVDQGVTVGVGALLNNSVVVSHDSVVGCCAFLSPGVVLTGGVRIGARCFVGAGSVVSNGVSIGDGSVVGIGSVVTRDLPPASHAIGNPARVLDRPLTLK